MEKDKRDRNSIAFRLALGAQLVLVGTALTLAYTRRLPAILRYLPDEVGHFFLIGVLAYLTHRVVRRRRRQVFGLLLPLGPLLVGSLAALEEGLQTLSPNRNASIGDLLADLAGILFFYTVDWLIVRHISRRAANQNDG